ncbi:MAG TPA: DmsE family decaheme c-type cytochrome [Holophagaceae bacterium]|nr:DmsE family decaheme c-type cytochrome [Holophagaceae bacterium]
MPRRGNYLLSAFAACLGLALAMGTGPLAAGTRPSLVTQDAPRLKGGTLGPNDCITCHEDAVTSFSHSAHASANVSCEACHSGGKAHIDSGGEKSKITTPKSLPPAEASALCMTCHNDRGRSHWAGSTHDSRKVSCITCHTTHPKGTPVKGMLRAPQLDLCTTCHLQQKAKLMRSGHMPFREGKVQCTSCHNPHGTANDKNLLQASVNEMCYTCHAEKRGPFLWEHPPVRENCLNCHDPHGTIQDNLLRVKEPMLCQQCHVGTRHPSQTHVASERFSFNKSCLNCHSQIHGSNHPSGARFMR